MYKLYIHSGSGNHGCEAIIRSTRKILNSPLELYSTNPNDDKKYNIDEIVDVIGDIPMNLGKHRFCGFLAAVYHKLMKTDYLYSVFRHYNLVLRVKKGDVCFSIGGDNYCYRGTDILGHINLTLKKKGAKTVLWGCSIEPEVLNLKSVVEDLKRYDLITVRETCSQKALADAGIVDNVRLFSDPAFQLEMVERPLPEHFIPGNTVAINISPLIIRREAETGITFMNYKRLMDYILNETNMNIVLLPHVVWDSADDRKPLRELYELYKDTNRIAILDDFNCEELKGYISKCRFLIAARTHATIAAYSTCVPTLVVGYSIKAKGIAIDLFGDDKNYVVPVQSLKNESDLLKAFCWIVDHEADIKKHLEEVMPEYKQKAMQAGAYIRSVLG
ncbi:MAG: polysaccharide pyruvyl transferase family protein [Lachnospiraceae bacterium]|nr:polysaccharide pyruvyl transferase family protein [Lachnospiraceae bacterium]